MLVSDVNLHPYTKEKAQMMEEKHQALQWKAELEVRQCKLTVFI